MDVVTYLCWDLNQFMLVKYVLVDYIQELIIIGSMIIKQVQFTVVSRKHSAEI